MRHTVTRKIVSRPHRQVKTNRKQSKRRDLHLKWPHHAANDDAVYLFIIIIIIIIIIVIVMEALITFRTVTTFFTTIFLVSYRYV